MRITPVRALLPTGRLLRYFDIVGFRLVRLSLTAIPIARVAVKNPYILNRYCARLLALINRFSANSDRRAIRAKAR
jgi:hypothetical protein